jgi:hypothetical protein
MCSIKKFTVSLLVLLLSLISAAAAGTFEFTVKTKSAFDQMAAAADQATAHKLNKQYADLKLLQKQSHDWDKKISELHYRNKQAMNLTLRRIKEIDAAKIVGLEAEAKRTRERYEPLFNLYESLNQQLNLSKTLETKGMSSLLRPQVESMKVAVRLARRDIRTKAALVKTAKSARTIKMKRIRKILADMDSNTINIKRANSTVSRTKKLFTAEINTLNQAVKKGDSAGSINSFTRLLYFQRQIIEQKLKIYSYEQQITAVIRKAESQISAQ